MKRQSRQELGWRCGSSAATRQPADSAAGKTAQASGIHRAGLAQPIRDGRKDLSHVMTPETEQRRDVADAVELRMALHVEKFHVTRDHAWQNRFGDVHHFL